MPSWNENDLSRRLPRLDQAVRLGRLLERELCTDDRPDYAALPQLENVAGGALDQVGPPAHQAVEEEAVDADVATHEPPRVDGLPESARVADRDRRPELLHEAERC